MVSKKEYFKKRWLYFIAIAFTFIVPFIILLEGLFSDTKKKAVVPTVILVVGIIYLFTTLKFFRKKIPLMKHSVGKIILEKSTLVVPFVIAYCLVFLVKKFLIGFDYYLLMICFSMVLGLIFELIDFIINKKFIYRLKIYSNAKEEVDRRRAEKEYEEALEALEKKDE